MTASLLKVIDGTGAISSRIAELFNEQRQNIIRHTDRLFSWLMIFQWFFAVGVALWLSPRTWSGMDSQIHPHVWFAIFLGGLITSLPVYLARKHPGETLTRHTVAVGQMLMSALLIHLTGGRIETHFHVFGSLAILAFYRDWKVLVSATAVVYVDHLARGYFWPQSVYGVLHATVWRSFEHAGWVLFEVTFLIISIRKSLSEMLMVAERQAKLENLNETIEQTIAQRATELRESQALYHSLVEQMPAGVFRKDVAGRYVLVNSWFCKLCGINAQEILGKTASEIAASEAREKKDLPMNQGTDHHKEIMRTGKALPPMEEHHNAGGQSRYVQAIKTPVFGADGSLVGSQGILMDITDAKLSEMALRCSEEKLQQSQKMEAVGRLAGGVAHDFNNLLTVIGGYCSMSLHDMDTTHPLHKSITEIQKASERAASLTGQLLAFSRKQMLQPRVMQLNDVLRNMEKMLRRLIGEDVHLSTVFDTSLGHVKADPGQIEQVIMNLAVNARDAMPRGGKLTLSTSNVRVDEQSNYRNRTLEIGEYVLLAISDNGVGMTSEVKAHLFEPFFTTKGIGKGTGLGLATCYGIICQSGGDIRVYSEANSGTTFKIYLPRTDAPLDSAMAADSTQLSAGNESILLVEDDPAVRKLAMIVLSNCGYKIQESNNAFEALALIKRNPCFDLIISDVIMPQMSGKELCDQIKDHFPHMRVLLMSGYTDDALAHHGVLDEGVLFLEKPFSPAKLTRKVREILDSKNGVSPLPINGSKPVLV
jgi:PAS domain S-box-containing protein